MHIERMHSGPIKDKKGTTRKNANTRAWKSCDHATHDSRLGLCVIMYLVEKELGYAADPSKVRVNNFSWIKACEDLFRCVPNLKEGVLSRDGSRKLPVTPSIIASRYANMWHLHKGPGKNNWSRRDSENPQTHRELVPLLAEARKLVYGTEA